MVLRTPLPRSLHKRSPRARFTNSTQPRQRGRVPQGPRHSGKVRAAGRPPKSGHTGTGRHSAGPYVRRYPRTCSRAPQTARARPETSARAVRGLRTTLPALGRGRRGQFPRGKAPDVTSTAGPPPPCSNSASASRRRPLPPRTPPHTNRPPPPPLLTPRRQRGLPETERGRGAATPERLRPLLGGGRRHGREESGRAPPHPSTQAAGGAEPGWACAVCVLLARGSGFASPSTAADNEREVGEEAGRVGGGALQR